MLFDKLIKCLSYIIDSLKSLIGILTVCFHMNFIFSFVDFVGTKYWQIYEVVESLFSYGSFMHVKYF